MVFVVLLSFGICQTAVAAPEFINRAEVPKLTEIPRQVASQTPQLQAGRVLSRFNVKNAEIEPLLRSLASETGRNVVIQGGVKGTVSVDLTDVTVDDAFKAVLRASKLGAERHGDLLVIRSIEDSQFSEAFQLRYINGATVREGLEKFLSKSGKLNFDPDTNTILVRDNPEVIEDISAMIEQIDRTPRQVLVESAILEITLDDTVNSGVSVLWQDANFLVGTQNFAKNPLTTTDGGFFFRVVKNGITGLIDLLQTRTKTKLLAHPRILALNDQQAEILIGDRDGFKTTVQLNTGATQETINFLETGTRLIFTPHLTENNEILMKIHPEVSSGVIKDNIPSEKTTEATTSIKVQDGQTIILGGLIREQWTDTDTQVPILGDIPLVGILFKKKNRKLERKEVVIMITPNIINEKDMDSIRNQIKLSDEEYTNTINDSFVGLKPKPKAENGKEVPPSKKERFNGLGVKII